MSRRRPEQPDGDIEIRVIGKRPGEKLVEQLFYDPSTVIETEHPKILKARRQHNRSGVSPEAIDDLRSLIAGGNADLVRRKLLDFANIDKNVPPSLRVAGGTNT